MQFVRTSPLSTLVRASSSLVEQVTLNHSISHLLGSHHSFRYILVMMLSVVPGILNWFEASDLISLIAPRSFIAVGGVKDHIFPHKGAKSVVGEASLFYEKLGAAHKISALETGGEHIYYGQHSWEYFKYSV